MAAATGDKLDIRLTQLDRTSGALETLKVGLSLEIRQQEDVLEFLDCCGALVGSAPSSCLGNFEDVKVLNCKVRTIKRCSRVS